MITIGLALFRNNLQKVYAIDANPFAIENCVENITEQARRYNKGLKERIQPVHGDYNDPETIKKIMQEQGSTIDGALFAHSMFVGTDNLSSLFLVQSNLVKTNGTTLLCWDVQENDEDTLPLQEIVNEQFSYMHGQALQLGITCSPVGHMKICFNYAIAMTRIKK